MKLFKKRSRETITRYKDFNEFQNTLIEEASQTEKRLRAKGIAAVQELNREIIVSFFRISKL